MVAFLPSWLRLNEVLILLAKRGIDPPRAEREIARAIGEGGISGGVFTQDLWRLPTKPKIDRRSDLTWLSSPNLDFVESTIKVPPSTNRRVALPHEPALIELRRVQIDAIWPADVHPKARRIAHRYPQQREAAKLALLELYEPEGDPGEEKWASVLSAVNAKLEKSVSLDTLKRAAAELRKAAIEGHAEG